MNSQSSHIRTLFLKYSAGEARPEEVQELLTLLSEGNYDQEINGYMEEQMSAAEPQTNFDVDRWENVFAGIQQRTTDQNKTAKLWPRMLAVAAAVALIVIGVYFFNYRNGKQLNNDALIAQDIAPGKVGATLTLANGKRILLTDAVNGEIVKEAGILVTKTADGQLVYQIKETTGSSNKMNTLSTSNGETYILTLPDKSKVWLNAASSLTYSAVLNERGIRKVKLEGEAYFEVFKDKVHPFVVETDNQEVEVLGTHFNINSYKDEPVIATTLLEGSVKVNAKDNNRIIKPGEQAVNNGNSIKVSKVNVDKVVDWKEGEFDMNHINFKLAMRKIARWYDVEIIYNASVPDDMEIGGWVSRNEKLSSVLKSIESAGLVRFKIEGRKIYVSK